MKALNLALVALAGIGLVTSEIASADTLPGSALPSISHARPAKLVRLTDKRQGQASTDVAGLGLAGIFFGAITIGGIVYALAEVSKGNKVYSSTGG